MDMEVASLQVDSVPVAMALLSPQESLAAAAARPHVCMCIRSATSLTKNKSCVYQVDGVPVATAPVVPAPEIGGGRRRLLQRSSTSVFSVIIIAPSTSGVHTIVGALCSPS